MKILNWLKQKRYIIIALIIYFITCVTLYIVEYRIYGGAINTNIFYITILPIVNLIVWILRDDHDNEELKKEKKTTFWSRVGNICTIIINVLLMLYCIYQLYKNIYYLFGYQYLATISMVGILYFSKKLSKFIKQGNAISKTVSIIYGIILITTLLYVILLNPYTVKRTHVIVENSGLTNISYKNNIKDKKMLSIILDAEVTKGLKYEDSLGYYLLKGEKDKKDYAVVVSVTRGTIVTFTEVNANTALRYIIDK